MNSELAKLDIPNNKIQNDTVIASSESMSDSFVYQDKYIKHVSSRAN